MNDGSTKRIQNIHELVPGCIIRRVNDDGTQAPFSDAIVLHILSINYVKVLRPYAVGTCLDTGCPFGYLGSEEYEITETHLQSAYVMVLNSKGEPYTMVVGGRV